MTLTFSHADIIGLIGTACIILAYFLNQSRLLTSTDIRYPLINLVGACLLLYSLYFVPNLPSIVIEVFWIAISLMGIAKALKERKKA
jgi:hypothetical protein